jgi:hypothetical protein
MIPQAEVDAQLEHARQRAAALKVERHTLDQREDAYAVNAAVYGQRPEPAPYATQNDDGHPEALIVWLGIAACFGLGAPLTFVCLPWAALAPTFANVAGAVGGVLLLLMGVAATGRMVGRR